MSERYPCLLCQKHVRINQHAVQCGNCEGWQHRTCDTRWHRRLNSKTGAAPPFYVLIDILYREARETEEQIQLVTELCLKRIQRKKFRSMQQRLFDVWDLYTTDQLTTSGLLKKISVIYGPTVE